MKTVRVGFASFAHLHGWSYANVVKRLPGAEIAGLFDEDAARRKKMAAGLGDVPAFDSMAALLGERPDAVVVCSENARHREFTEAAANLMHPCRTIGVAVNGARFNDAEVAAECAEVRHRLGLPAVDVLRHGPEELVQAVLELKSQRGVGYAPA